LNGIKHENKLNWNVSYSSDGHRSYLDVCAHNGILYTTSSQNEEGYCIISRAYLVNQELVSWEFVFGTWLENMQWKWKPHCSRGIWNKVLWGRFTKNLLKLI